MMIQAYTIGGKAHREGLFTKDVSRKIGGGKSWSFGCDRTREDRESQDRCQMDQAAPQSGAHLRGRNAQRVLARTLRRRGRGVNDVVFAGEAR